MKRSTAYYQHRKMIKELDEHNGKFRPTKQDVEDWFDILNEQIFGNKLPDFTYLRIGRPRNAHAFFTHWHDKKETELWISEYFPSKKLFVEILAHEMIHLFQYHYNEPLGHGPSFWVWRDLFNIKGIDLHKAA